MNLETRFQRTGRVLQYMGDNPIPFLAIAAVIAIQVISLKIGSVATFTRSYIGAFAQGILATVAFGEVTADTLKTFRRRRSASRLFDTLMLQIKDSQDLKCRDLESAFRSLSLLKGLKYSYQLHLQQAEPDECAIFVLGYQFYGNSVTIGGFDAACLTEIARYAANSRSYRCLVTTLSLSYLVNFEQAAALADEIEEKATAKFAASSRSSEADLRLETKLAQAKSESLLIVGTTSQHSGFSFELIKRHASRISDVTVVHLSPYILSHSALREQSREASVPSAVIPAGQQMRDGTIDMMRRVIRILVGVEDMHGTVGAANISLCSAGLKERSLGVKVRALRTSTYLQLFPGPLMYAGNTYRFGYEISDSSLAQRLLEVIDSKIETAAFKVSSDKEFDLLLQRSIAELGRWMTGLPQIVERLSAHYSSLLELLPENRARAILQSAMDVLAAGIEATQSAEMLPTAIRQHKIFVPIMNSIANDPRVILSGNELGHVSAGVFVLDRNKILVVRKTTAPNVGRWSIPAGHCLWGESASLAAQRELKEETGLDGEGLELLWTGEVDERVPCRYNKKLHLWFLYVLRATSPVITLDPGELSEFRWLTLDAASRIRQPTPAFRIILHHIDVEKLSER